MINTMGLSRMGRRAFAAAVFVAILAAPSVGMPAAPGLLQPLNLAGYPPGEMPPEFSGRTPDGQTVTLAGLRGKVVLVNFWAAWCPECRPEMPLFERLHLDFAAQGLAVLGINAGEGVETIRRYAKEMGLTFPLVLDPDSKIQRLYGVIGIPTTFLIARDGYAVARAIGPREWGSAATRALIKTLLAEPTPKSVR